jgi:hypothetical protein
MYPHIAGAAWKNATGELCRVTRECLELARVQGESGIIEIAESAAAKVRGQCPIEAAMAGLERGEPIRYHDPSWHQMEYVPGTS